MISVRMIIIRVSANILWSIMELMVNHLGKNPMNGGSPPRDRKLRLKRIFNCFDCVREFIN